jgi:hypothetical protein
VNPFRPKPPSPIQDAELGTLRFLRGRWQSEPAPDGTVLVVRAGRRGPDAGLRAAAVHARQQLAALEGRARDYLATEADPERPRAQLTLVAVEIFRPAARWFAREMAHGGPTKSGTGVKDPVCALWFAIENDRNVIEVFFVRDLAIAWDYH